MPPQLGFALTKEKRSININNMNNNNKQIEFNCLEEKCKQPIAFRLLDIEKNLQVKCQNCNKDYSFNRDLVNKLKKFDKLISAIREAKDILSDTNVAINFKKYELRVPYRLLLTRMNTLLTLNIGNDKIVFKFRVEPLEEEDQLQIKTQ